MIETLVILIVLIVLIINTVKRPKNFPPGPIPFPLVGNFLSIDHFNPQNSWSVNRRSHGDVVGMVFPKIRFVVVSGWKAVREALANEDLNGRPDVCLLRDRFDGGRYGIAFHDGPDWKIQRRFTLHHFRNLGFGRKSHELVVHEEVENLLQELLELKGVPIAVEERFMLSAINITWCLLGGRRYDRKDPLLKKLANFVKESMHSVKTIGSPAVVFPFLRYLFPNQTGYRQIKHGCHGILDFVKKAITDHVNANNEDGVEDFIGIYLRQMSENPEGDQSFSVAQLEGICMDLLSAGADTSSSVLSFAILFLCKNTILQQKISDEICTVIGSEKTPTIDDRPRLSLTDAFIHEVLRFRTVTPTFPPHRALKDTVLGGYNVPKDCIIAVNYESVLMDPEYWGDPEVFRPERFLDSEGRFRKEERLMSFGKGKRSCLGENLAKMTVFLIFSSLVQKFEFRFSDEGEPRDTKGVPGFTYAAPDFSVVVNSRISDVQYS